MILTCPNCATRFRVPESAIGPQGRRVRCSACGHLWFVDVETPPDATAIERDDLPPPASTTAFESDGRGAAVATDDAAEEDYYARRHALRGRRETAAPKATVSNAAPSPLVLAGWGIWLAFLIGLGITLYAFRPTLEALWPPISRLYAVIGMNEDAPVAKPVPPPSADEAITVWLDPQPDWIEAGDGWTVTIRGSLTNTAGTAVEVPPLTLELVDAEAKILKRVAVPLTIDHLPPGGVERFTVVVPRAPAETTGIIHLWKQGANADAE